MPLTALLDADIIAFKEAAIAAADNPFEDSNHINHERALVAAIAECETWRNGAEADKTLLVFSHAGRRNFRKTLYPERYKAKRSPEKPPAYWPIVEGLKKRYPFFEIDGVEGDDTMGILHTSREFGDSITVSTDKDMQTIPGLLFNPQKFEFPVEQTLNQANHFWMFQTLAGDSADGYPGCPGIGPVKAERALPIATETHDEDKFLYDCWDVVVDLFERAGLTVDDAVLQARMARILRREDYNEPHNSIRLWHPDSPEWIYLDEFNEQREGSRQSTG